MAIGLLLATLVVGMASPDTTAPEVGDATASSGGWRVGLQTEVLRLPERDSRWLDYAVGLERLGEGYAIGVQGRRSQRYGLVDHALHAEAYADLWPGAYVHMRVQGSGQPNFLPRAGVMAEMYQGLGRGWVVSGGYRRMRYPQESVSVALASLSKYYGSWYFQGRIYTTFAFAEEGITSLVRIRYYYQGADSYAQISAGTGQEIISVGPGPDIRFLTTQPVVAGVHHRLSRRFTVSVNGQYMFQEAISRWGGRIGLLIEI